MGALTVAGGVGGITACCDDIERTAGIFGAAAGECADDGTHLAAGLVDPSLAGSMALDPLTGAGAEAALMRAAAEVAGLAAACGVVDAALRSAAAAYRSADRLNAAFHDRVWPVLNLPGALVGAAMTAGSGGVAAGLERFVTADPGLADDVADALPGGPGAATGLLARAYPDGGPVVQALGSPRPVPGPRSVADLLRDLAERDAGVPGEIEVRVTESAGGRRHVVVDIPGTKDWSPALRQQDVTSLGTNLRALGGAPTTYEAGVLLAMSRAGVRPDDDVLLVGHSEGGMVALNLATRQAAFRITHVITAGAPIGLTAVAVPPSVTVLALENRGDVVPHLDGRSNADRPNVVTVGFDVDHADVLANHDVGRSYVPGAALVDASDDPSIVAVRAGLTPFLTGQDGLGHTFVVTRTYR